MFGVHYKDEHFFHGDDIIWIDFEEIFQLYHQDAVDVSLIAC